MGRVQRHIARQWEYGTISLHLIAYLLIFFIISIERTTRPINIFFFFQKLYLIMSILIITLAIFPQKRSIERTLKLNKKTHAVSSHLYILVNHWY